MRFGWSAATGAGEADPGEFIGLVISPDCGFAAVTTDDAPRCPLTILKSACRARFGRYRRTPATGIHPAGKNLRSCLTTSQPVFTVSDRAWRGGNTYEPCTTQACSRSTLTLRRAA